MAFYVWGNKVMLTFLPQLPWIRSSANVTAEHTNNFLPLCQFSPGISGTSQVFLQMLMHGSQAS